METTIECPIWGTGYEETLHKVWITFEGKLDIDGEEPIISERAGGPYRLVRQAFAAIWRLEERGKARLTTWLVDMRWKKKIEVPLVTDVILKSLGSAYVEQTLSVPERAERLLHFIACQTGIVPGPMFPKLKTLMLLMPGSNRPIGKRWNAFGTF